MSDPVTHAPESDQPDPRVARVRSLVLKLAVFVLFTLLLGFASAMYNYATDRSTKELFYGPESMPH